MIDLNGSEQVSKGILAKLKLCIKEGPVTVENGVVWVDLNALVDQVESLVVVLGVETILGHLEQVHV